MKGFLRSGFMTGMLLADATGFITYGVASKNGGLIAVGLTCLAWAIDRFFLILTGKEEA